MIRAMQSPPYSFRFDPDAREEAETKRSAWGFKTLPDFLHFSVRYVPEKPPTKARRLPRRK